MNNKILTILMSVELKISSIGDNGKVLFSNIKLIYQKIVAIWMN